MTRDSYSQPSTLRRAMRGALGHWPVITTLVIALSVTLMMHNATCNSAERAAEQKFRAACTETTGILIDRLDAYTSLLTWGRGFIYASNSVDRDEWRSYVEAGELEDRHPGVFGFAYIQRVHTDEVAEFEAAARAGGVPEFAVRPHSQADTAGDSEWHYVIKYHEPESRNSGALGVDVATKSVSRELYDRAMRTGEVQLSDPIRLIQQGAAGQQGVVMVLPVYKSRETPATESERVKQLFVWVGLPIAMTTFLDRESIVDPALLAMEITAARPDGTMIKLCGTHDEHAIQHPRISDHRAVEFGGVTLVLDYAPGSDAAFRPDITTASIVLLGGGAVSVLLAGIVFTTTRTRIRAEGIADAISADLRASEARAVHLAQGADAANSAKSAFLAHMSHEIRTPMNAILGYAELLEHASHAEHPDQDQIGAHVHTIHRNGEYLLAIINDILDLSKIEAGRMTVELIDTQLPSLLTSVEQLMRVRAADRGIGLRFELAGSIPETVRTDPVRLRQILVNLIGNAIKFTEVGSVTARVGITGRDSASPTLRIEVIDTGIGISPAQLSGLFEPFSQADSSITRRFGGTGLGLQISSTLAQLLDGTIRAESREGQGSVFTLEVPVNDLASAVWVEDLDAVQDERPQPQRFEGTPFSGVRVLLVEDGPDNRRLLTHHLGSAGAEVTIAENGREALEAMTVDGCASGALPDRPKFDMVITDIQMPEIDGYRLTELLRERGWDRPIIVMTAHAMASDEQRCFEAGCSHFATKPIAKADLLAVCSSALLSDRLRRAA